MTEEGNCFSHPTGRYQIFQSLLQWAIATYHEMGIRHIRSELVNCGNSVAWTFPFNEPSDKQYHRSVAGW
jgi:hypothetical protein